MSVRGKDVRDITRALKSGDQIADFAQATNVALVLLAEIERLDSELNDLRQKLAKG